MANHTLEMKQLGLRIKFLRTAADTGGELLEMEVEGCPRGFLSQQHVHGGQVERLEVVSGTLKVVIEGREHVLSQGQSIEVPAGAPHTQVPVGDGRGVVRIQVRPAGRTQAFLERLAELCREGKITRMGFPRPVAGAELVLEYGDTGHAAKPSLRVQRAIAAAWWWVLRTRWRRTCSSTNGTWPRHRRPCSTRSPTLAPTRGGGARSTSTSTPPGRWGSAPRLASISRGGSRTTSTRVR